MIDGIGQVIESALSTVWTSEGGSGSGNFGHSGRIGSRGGSGGSGGGGSISSYCFGPGSNAIDIKGTAIDPNSFETMKADGWGVLQSASGPAVDKYVNTRWSDTYSRDDQLKLVGSARSIRYQGDEVDSETFEDDIGRYFVRLETPRGGRTLFKLQPPGQ